MFKAMTAHEDTEESQLRSTNVHHYQMTRTAIICSNMLISAGLRHILEGTNFLTTDVLVKLTDETDASPLSDTNLFIVQESGPVESILAIIRQLRGAYSEARIAIMADSYDLQFVQLCLNAGATGFCQMGNNREVLIKSLDLVVLGELVLPKDLMTFLLTKVETRAALASQGHPAEGKGAPEHPRTGKLSPREAEILRHLMEGAANKVIARKLDVAEATIKVHIKAILRKVGAANRTQAAMWASTHLPTGNMLHLSS
jgi:two-component system nitrate/nitrite response regulator NarL